MPEAVHTSARWGAGREEGKREEGRKEKEEQEARGSAFIGIGGWGQVSNFVAEL